MSKLDSAMAKLNEISEMKSRLVLENKKVATTLGFQLRSHLK